MRRGSARGGTAGSKPPAFERSLKAKKRALRAALSRAAPPLHGAETVNPSAGSAVIDTLEEKSA